MLDGEINTVNPSLIKPRSHFLGATFRPEELRENIDGVHSVLVLLVQDKVAESAAVFGPEVFPWSFQGHKRKGCIEIKIMNC